MLAVPVLLLMDWLKPLGYLSAAGLALAWLFAYTRGLTRTSHKSRAGILNRAWFRTLAQVAGPFFDGYYTLVLASSLLFAERYDVYNYYRFRLPNPAELGIVHAAVVGLAMLSMLRFVRVQDDASEASRLPISLRKAANGLGRSIWVLFLLAASFFSMWVFWGAFLGFGHALYRGYFFWQ